MKTYIKYTQREVLDNNFQPWIKLNWLYDLSFFLDYKNYQNEKIISITDWENFIPTTWTEKLWVVEHTLAEEEINYFISSIPAEFKLEIITEDEVLDYIRTNTDFEEVETWKFLIYKADEEMWIEEDKYLII